MHGNMMIFDPDLPHNHLHFSMFFAHSATINVLYIRSRVRRKNMLLSQFLSTSDNKGGFGAGGGGGRRGNHPPPLGRKLDRQYYVSIATHLININTYSYIAPLFQNLGSATG